MKEKSYSVWKRGISLAMAILFFSVIFLQAFHAHSGVFTTNDQEECFTDNYPEKCSVCDYILHKLQVYDHLAFFPALKAPVTKASVLLGACYAGNHKITLQGYTNKGPPGAC